jgi:hypothetical protein
MIAPAPSPPRFSQFVRVIATATAVIWCVCALTKVSEGSVESGPRVDPATATQRQQKKAIKHVTILLWFAAGAKENARLTITVQGPEGDVGLANRGQ